MNSLSWARAAGGERGVLLGALGLQLAAPPGSGPGERGIAGLQVWTQEPRIRADYHVASGLYGFLGLPTETELRVQVHDPERRFLDAAFLLVAPDRSAVRVALEAGDEPPADDLARLLVRRTLWPSPERAPVPGTTELWGEVRSPAQPDLRCFALVECRARVGTTEVVRVGHATAHGAFAIHLPGRLDPHVAAPGADPVDDPFLPPPPFAPAASVARVRVRVFPLESDARARALHSMAAPGAWSRTDAEHAPEDRDLAIPGDPTGSHPFAAPHVAHLHGDAPPDPPHASTERAVDVPPGARSRLVLELHA